MDKKEVNKMKRKEKEIICNNHKAILHQLAAELAENDIQKYGEPTILFNTVQNMYKLSVLNDSELNYFKSWLYLMEKIRIVRKLLILNNNHTMFDSDCVNTNNLLIGMEIRDYQTLCDLLGEKTKTGKARILQMNNWKRYFDYEKIKYSNSYIILDIYPEPLPKEHKDYRNSLFVNEFKVLILTQLLQAEINDSGSIIYHTTFRKIIEKMNVVHKRFFNHNVTNMILQKINECFDDDMIKKIRWNYQKFYSTVYRKLKDSIDYSLKQLEKDNMIKVNYYNVIFDKDENETHKATKDEEAKILTIKKETAELLGFKNSTIATVHNADRYNNELQKAYDAEGWKYVYYEIEIITNSDNLKRHINEYTALNTIQNIYDLSNTDIKKLQSKANNNMIQSLCDRLSNNQTEELKTIRDNDIDLIDYSYDDIKEMFSFGSGTYNNTDYERMYNDFVEYLIKNNYN